VNPGASVAAGLGVAVAEGLGEAVGEGVAVSVGGTGEFVDVGGTGAEVGGSGVLLVPTAIRVAVAGIDVTVGCVEPQPPTRSEPSSTSASAL
jgi:hypothetical protein